MGRLLGYARVVCEKSCVWLIAALHMDLTESEQPTSPCRSTSPYKNVYFSRNIMGHILRRDSIIYWSGYSMKALSKGMGI